MLLLILACEPSAGPAKPDPDPFDSGPTRPTDTAPTEPPVEACNGVDDDADGEVDEGFPDGEPDGLPDCLDVCDGVARTVGGPVAMSELCSPWTGEVVTDPWQVEEAWSVTLESEEGEPMLAGTAPVVVPEGEDTSIFIPVTDVARSYEDGRGLVIDASGAVLEDWAGLTTHPASSMARLEGGAAPALFTTLSARRVARTSLQGETVWASEDGVGAGNSEAVVVSDLDRDGLFEVTGDLHVFQVTGTPVFDLDPPLSNFQARTGPTIADLDLDRRSEIVVGRTVFGAAGEVLWEAPIHEHSEFAWAAVVQADTDPEGELVFVSSLHGDVQVTFLEADGSRYAEDLVMLGVGEPGPPCAGDLDGDGEMELAVPLTYTLVALELDGGVLWTDEAWDESTGVGCATSDLDGDGVAEVLYAGELWFSIHDGRDGAVVYRDDGHRSTTGQEYPVVVDLDGDDHAELLLAGGSSTEPGVPFLRALRHAGGGWTPGGRAWTSHDFSMSQTDEDGVFMADPEPSWTRYGVYRGRLASPDGHPRGRDLALALVDVCVGDCTYGRTAVSYTVSNPGALDVPAGGTVAVYAVDAHGERLVATDLLPAVPAGTALDGRVVEFPSTALGPLGLRLVADDDGTGTGAVLECDETNNEARWEAAACP